MNPTQKPTLRKLDDMFGLSSSEPEAVLHEKEELEIEKLIPFEDHPFKLYEGERLRDMINSIKEHGVLMPVLVQPKRDSYGSILHYEILSGHNRVNAAKAAGLEKVPVIIKDGLSKEEAFLIVTETNLVQRSFTDLSHSERVLVISKHYQAIKAQGKRNDLIQEIEMFSKPYDLCGDGVLSTKIVGQNYNLGKESIKRYLRLENIHKGLLERLDQDALSLRAAVSLSYLKAEEQEKLERILTEEEKGIIDMKMAEMMREQSDKGRLSEEQIKMILRGEKKGSTAKPSSFKLKPKIITRFFSPSTPDDEVEDTIIKALDLYFNGQQGEDENE